MKIGWEGMSPGSLTSPLLTRGHHCIKKAKAKGQKGERLAQKSQQLLPRGGERRLAGPPRPDAERSGEAELEPGLWEWVQERAQPRHLLTFS